MSQTNSNTVAHISAPSSLSSPPSNDQPIETTDKKDTKTENSNDPVIPWENEPQSVSIKSFAGYDIKFNGWVRKDIKEQRKLQKAREQEEGEQLEI